MKKAILFGTVLVAVTTLVAVPKTRKVFVQYLNDFKYYYNSCLLYTSDAADE